MPFNQRLLIHREAWFPGGPRIPINPIFLKNGKNHQKCKNSKMSRDMSKLALRPLTWSLIHREAWFPSCFVRQNQKKKEKNCAAILDHFQTKMFKCKTTSFHFPPQGFQISKNIGHPTSGSGGKKTVKRNLKSEHTDKHTDTQTDRPTDISTHRKHRPRGPML